MEEEIILSVKSIEQQFKYNCGPAALLIMLRYQFGVTLTQRDLNFVTGVTKDGASEHHLMRALDVLGFRYDETSHGNLSQLRDYLKAGQLPMVHAVLEDGGGHYLVVVGLNDTTVFLADPRGGDTLKWGIPFFLGVWKEEAKENSTPWYLVITGQVADKIENTIAKYKRIRKKIQQSRG